MPDKDRQFLEFDRFRIALPDRQLLHGDEVVALTPKAFDTLLVLAESAGTLVSKEELLEAVWPDSYVEEATLTQNIYTVRKTLAAAGARDEIIETVPRRGYRFRPAVSRRSAQVFATRPLRNIRQSSEAGAFGASPSPEGSAAKGVAGVSVFPAAAPGGRPGGRVHLAVFPFRALSGGEEEKLLAVGLADALIGRLSNTSELSVRSTSSVLRFSDEVVSSRKAGRDLKVEAVLEGTIQSFGTKLRVNAQLVGTERGETLWAQHFDAEAGDPFSLQDEISEQLAAALRVKLARPADGGRPPKSQEAYQAYLRGRFFWNKRTAEDLTTAVRWLRKSVELDPDYARAYAGLADCYVLLPLYAGLRPHEAFPQAIEAAERALALDDTLAEAHTALAYANCFFHWNWSATEAGYHRALQLNPGYATALHWRSFYLSARGRHDEAAESARQAQQLDPLSLVINTDLGFVLYFARRAEAALEQHRRTLELDPSFAYARFALALTWELAGLHDEAVREAERAVQLTSYTNTAMIANLGYLLGRAGNRERGAEILALLAKRAEDEHVPASRFALVQLGLNRKEEALESLRLACQERSRFVVFLNVWPLFDPLRDEPRFQELLNRADLCPSPPR